MKKKLPCVYIPTAPLLSHRLLQSWGSLGCPLSSYTLLLTALLYKILVLCKPFLSPFQPLWSKKNRGEGRSQTSRWLFLVQKQTLESLSPGRTLSSAESPCAPGEGRLTSLQKREEEQRHRGSVLRPCSPMHMYFHQSQLGRRWRVKGCPAKLSSALGPNSILL